MNRAILVFGLLILFAIMVVTWPLGPGAVALIVVLVAPIIFVIQRNDLDRSFLLNLFVLALLARLLFGTFVQLFDFWLFFGGDAGTYDYLGNLILEYRYNTSSFDSWDVERATSTTSPGWGMNYLVASIYFILGRNMLAAQFFCSIFGAASAPLAYSCTYSIFRNIRASRVTGILVAFFPSFIIWSSQLLKDGLVIFLLLAVMVTVIQLQKKLRVDLVAYLILSLAGIISLRFYIFYMVVVAVVGSFLVGQSSTSSGIWRRLTVLLLLGISLTYLGVLRTAEENFNKYGDLAKVQRSRSDLAKSAESGFGEDLDVSTTEGAILAVPVGFVYLMFAPFPWTVVNIRQAITIPEVLLWWAMIPLMCMGVWYTIKHKLLTSIPILIFSIMLTFAYSIFQGNVGTAYRQRTQIQVFLFIFVAVGWSLLKERKEIKRQSEMARRVVLRES